MQARLVCHSHARLGIVRRRHIQKRYVNIFAFRFPFLLERFRNSLRDFLFLLR